MYKIIVWGTGQYGEEAYKYLEETSDYNIVGVCDTNPIKQGTVFFRQIVRTVDEALTGEFDILLLCASKWDDMLKEACSKGVEIADVRIWTQGMKMLNESCGMEIHSQDGEELYLREKFAEQGNGLYVDVGAYHPIRFSNTLWAYNKGWKGINIEPNPDGVDLFNILRPKDININCGVSNTNATFKYYRFQEGALNTFSSDRVKYLERCGYRVDSVIDVPVVPLQDIFDKYKIEKINYLDIDVEEHELAVLESIDFDRIEIELIMVEQLDMNLLEITQSEVAKFLAKKGFVPKQKYHRTVFYEK